MVRNCDDAATTAICSTVRTIYCPKDKRFRAYGSFDALGGTFKSR